MSYSTNVREFFSHADNNNEVPSMSLARLIYDLGKNGSVHIEAEKLRLISEQDRG